MGNSYLSRVTACLEEILNPISLKYCRQKVDEFCRDSKSYLEALTRWKNKNEDNGKKCFITAVDVKALYPNVTRELTKSALQDALQSCSNFSPESRKAITNATLHCLENAIVQFQGHYYKQAKGIITGDNNSVSLANISLHFIVQDIPEIAKHAVIFQRFIDDIIYITREEDHNETIKKALVKNFKDYELDLTFREVSTGGYEQQVEFLDVLHVTDENSPHGFYTKDFIKPTAVGHQFLNGRSFHPNTVYRSIITGEANRMSRLNERTEDLDESLKRLEQKCLNSGFHKSLVSETLEKIKTRNHMEKKEEKTSKQKKDSMITWATQFKKLLKLNKQEKQLAPNAIVSFCKPPTLGNRLLNYKKISHQSQSSGTIEAQFKSSRCNRCGLCGKYGLKNMVIQTNHIQLRNGIQIYLKQNLNCKDYGIYIARCLKCQDYYTGQTKNSFSRRWNHHRAMWKKMNNINNREEQLTNNKNNNRDECALFVHYAKYHPESLQTKTNISDAYGIIFVEKPNLNDLDYQENYWITKTNSNINIARTYLPKYT